MEYHSQRKEQNFVSNSQLWYYLIEFSPIWVYSIYLSNILKSCSILLQMPQTRPPSHTSTCKPSQRYGALSHQIPRSKHLWTVEMKCWAILCSFMFHFSSHKLISWSLGKLTWKYTSYCCNEEAEYHSGTSDISCHHSNHQIHASSTARSHA